MASPAPARSLSLLTLTVQNSALILVMHYARTMAPAGGHRFFASTAVFLHELLKLAVSLSVATYEAAQTLAPTTPASTLVEQLANAVLAPDGCALALPAALFTLQNLLQYVAVGNLDPVHFQVLYQVKILATAVFSVVLLGRPLGLHRWAALVVLTLGIVVVSLPAAAPSADALLLSAHYFPRSRHELGQAALPPESHLLRRSASYEGIANDLPPPDPPMNRSAGAAAALVAALASGLAGVAFERCLKDGAATASVWVRNVQLSLYSLVAAALGGLLWQDGAGIREHGFFEGYSAVVWVAIVLQAAGGLISSLVIRDADNIVKNFATSFSIVLSFVVSVCIFDFAVTTMFVAGTALVLLATYMYSVPERGRHRPPAVRIVSFEKPAIDRLLTPGTTPRSADAARLAAADSGEARAVSSSRPSSPMLARQASRTHVHRED